MYQHLGQRIDDIIVFFIISYITLIYFKILNTRNENWNLKLEKLRSSKWGNAFKVLLPLCLVLLVLMIFWE